MCGPTFLRLGSLALSSILLIESVLFLSKLSFIGNTKLLLNHMPGTTWFMKIYGITTCITLAVKTIQYSVRVKFVIFNVQYS